MDKVLVFTGGPVYSDFRLADLERSIGAQSVRAVWIQYVQLQGSPSDETIDVLQQLLDDEAEPTKPDRHYQSLLRAVDAKGPGPSEGTQIVYVCPRPGTISPWSSKATSIAHVCGLQAVVKRIERGMAVSLTFDKLRAEDDVAYGDLLHDRMTQILSFQPPDMSLLFSDHNPAPARTVELHAPGITPKEALQKANRDLGLALDASEIEYLIQAYDHNGPLARDPFDVELFMFAQVNSEHCRHKQFNADWTIDGIRKSDSLFGMIKNTHKMNSRHTVSAYSDNAAVLQGEPGSFWAPTQTNGEWHQTKEVVHYVAKVETHNHPTAVSPYPGAATGSGGEIRDEGAVGRGSKPKAGLAGFNVSDLLIPGFRRPWELDVGKPGHIASSLDIMLEAPIGSAAFNNEFGRPCTTGYFRTLLTKVPFDDEEEIRGYHKPIMIAGGVGTVRPQNAMKRAEIVQSGAYVIVLGGPAMLIGLGGGAASSVTSGEASVDLDFASVQRGNPEMQRRAQMVIDACTALSSQNPIKLIHDVGAGGLSNALPELVHDAHMGAVFELRDIENADRGMSPLQIWCCEAQERYVMIVGEEGLATFEDIARRERCGYSLVGRARGDDAGGDRLVLTDRESKQFPNPIDLPMSTLFGKPPKLSRIVQSRKVKLPVFDSSLSSYLPKTPTDGLLKEAVNRVLTLPAVGSKSFLITIGDRTVGGLTVRDQMVGPWQVPVADVSVTATSLTAGIKTGEAMAMGERPTLALISPAASARMAVAESLTNLAAAYVLGGLERVRLSANWMSAINHPGEGAALYEAVEAIGMELCPDLGISIPVGKDSMSMKMRWTDKADDKPREVTAPLSVVISAFAPVAQISKTWTPTLRRVEDVGETVILFVDLAQGMKAMGGSALGQVFNQVGNEAPDVRDVGLIKDFFNAIRQLQESPIVLAYHDRSDGGLFTTLVEMMFAGRCGLDISLDHVSRSAGTAEVVEALFNEELGAVFQVRKEDEMEFDRCFATCGPPPGLISKIGRVTPMSSKQQELTLRHGPDVLYRESRANLQQTWASTSHHMQRMRDNPSCADEELASILDDADPGLAYHLTFTPKENILPLTTTISAALSRKPRVAILREQGVNGHAEMAFGFHTAGFIAVDVHMTDIFSGRVSLSDFVGLAACGGFSYGDVLGAGAGWAKSVLLHRRVREEFRTFFRRPGTFTLGVCNGCQFLTRLKSLIPGSDGWPRFERNTSEQYEARVCMVTVHDPSPTEGFPPSVFLHGMSGSAFPIVVAHGEGRAVFPSSLLSSSPSSPSSSTSTPTKPSPSSPSNPLPLPLPPALISLRYSTTTSPHLPTESYPSNPNGSPHGIAGVRSRDGRVLAMMPHPERLVLRDCVSWVDERTREICGEGGVGVWGRVFGSVRRWVG
ncbi:MAG: hypothetical protein M1817_000773 [Caeruleum heppii]|nr:MAG: hypothetical protein M1817_000773 [Caeruleum heppii]